MSIIMYMRIVMVDNNENYDGVFHNFCSDNKCIWWF